jgi:hypothetical protein
MAKTVKVNAVIVNNVNPTVTGLKKAMRQQASIHRRMLNTSTDTTPRGERKFRMVMLNGVEVKRFI